MALDLATVQVRTARQDRLTEHRSSIVPERRDTRAPDFQGSARMGSAARGDVGGAEELMRTLGLANKAAGSFSDYANAKFQKNERDNAAQGSIDAATGHVDAELEARSASYKNSVALGRTMTGFQSSLQSFGDDLHGLIENQDDADLATRQTEVKDRIDKFFRDFALDPDTGQLRGFLATPEAKRWLAGSMTETRAKLEATSLSRIEERFKGEALTHASTILGTQIDAGNIDIAGLRKLIPATVSDDELRSTILTTFQGKAEALKADGRYEDAMRTVNSLLGEGTAPGTVQTIDIEPSTSAPGASPAPKGKPTPVPRSQRVSFDTLAGAVMHVESRGDAAAVSPKGARGKMQTMPGTLRDPGFGVKPAANDSPQELERVGRDYLRAMLGRYNGNYVHALAAYNAGPGNVDKWLKRNPRATDAQFVDAIPFAETRDYIAKVMTRAGAGTAGGVETSPDNLIDDPNFATDPEPLNPVDAARQNPGVSLTPQLTGGLTLRPEERTKLLEYRDQLGREVRAEWDRKIKDGQDEKYGEFLQRLSGLGAPITPTEIAEASKRREITPTQTRQLLETVRSDRDRADALAERADNEAERDRIKRTRRPRTASSRASWDQSILVSARRARRSGCSARRPRP